jgi:hypothetical protein
MMASFIDELDALMNFAETANDVGRFSKLGELCDRVIAGRVAWLKNVPLAAAGATSAVSAARGFPPSDVDLRFGETALRVFADVIEYTAAEIARGDTPAPPARPRREDAFPAGVAQLVAAVKSRVSRTLKEPTRWKRLQAIPKFLTLRAKLLDKPDKKHERALRLAARWRMRSPGRPPGRSS